MPRINVVLVGTSAVLANGGLVVASGVYNIALLAHHFGVPFCVCTGLYKLSPHYPQTSEKFTFSLGPSTILDYSHNIFSKTEDGNNLIEALNPQNDYVPPELINLYITI